MAGCPNRRFICRENIHVHQNCPRSKVTCHFVGQIYISKVEYSCINNYGNIQLQILNQSFKECYFEVPVITGQVGNLLTEAEIALTVRYREKKKFISSPWLVQGAWRTLPSPQWWRSPWVLWCRWCCSQSHPAPRAGLQENQH